MGYTPFIDPAGRPIDITPPGISDVGGSVLNQGVISAYDIYTPAEMTQLFERHGYAPGMRMMMKTLGWSEGKNTPTTGHYEAPWKKDLLRIGTIVTPSSGAGTVIVAALAAAGMYNTNVSVSGNARQASYVRVGDIITFKDGKKGMVTAKNTAVNPHQVTIKPLQAAVDLASSLLASNNYFISGNAHAEGSGLPPGITPRVIKYSNEFQIVKDRVGATGSEMTNQTYFDPVPGQQGSFLLKAKADTYYRFECANDDALLFGDTIDNISTFVSDLGYDVAIKGTEGLLEFIGTNGYTINYTAGSLAMADFDAISRKYEQERIGVRDIMAWQGYDIYLEIENLLQAQLANDVSAQLTNRLMNRGAGENEPITTDDSALHIGFYALKKGGYRYYFKQLHNFNEAVGAGATGYNYTKQSIYHPLAYSGDMKTGAKKGIIGYEYKKLGNYSRENVIADLAGVGVAGTGTPYRIASSRNDIYDLGMVSEIAFHGACANHMMLQTP